MPKISVIVPIYNVEKYLECCLDSILNQSFTDFELLLIDDGSLDDCPHICDEYADKDSRIRVIHQKNAGSAAAKNAGLRVATGEYISFVDSDDYLEPGAYQHMIDLVAQYDADVVQCAYRYIYKDCAIDEIEKNGRNIYDKASYLLIYLTDWTCGLITDKLFKRELFEGIYFEEGHKIDDDYFTYQGLLNAKKIVSDDFITYNYRQRRSSVMLSPGSAKQILLDRIDCYSKRRAMISFRMPELRCEYDIHFLSVMILLSKDSNAGKDGIKQIRHSLLNYFRDKAHTRPPRKLWGDILRIFTFVRVSKESSVSSKCDNLFD